MRVVLMGLLLFAAPAMAQDCKSGRQDILTVTEWSAVMKDGNIPYPFVTVGFRNDGKKEIRMAKASVWFKDSLDDVISGVDLEKDLKLKPSAGAIQNFAMSGSTDFERLTTLEAKDARGYICVDAIMYEDGTKEEFK